MTGDDVSAKDRFTSSYSMGVGGALGEDLAFIEYTISEFLGQKSVRMLKDNKWMFESDELVRDALAEVERIAAKVDRAVLGVENLSLTNTMAAGYVYDYLWAFAEYALQSVHNSKIIEGSLKQLPDTLEQYQQKLSDKFDQGGYQEAKYSFSEVKPVQERPGGIAFHNNFLSWRL